LECLIIGGGPAGLTAAIYAARFRLRTLLVDAGDSRASQIPCTRNHAGFPNGIAGVELLELMRAQALRFSAELLRDKAITLSKDTGGFVAELASGGALRARAVILATGVSNHRPDMDDPLHKSALQRGLLRYCPVCDGFEVTDRNVGVLGVGARAVKEAMFLRSYTDRVTIISSETDSGLDDTQYRTLAALGVQIRLGPPRDWRLDEKGVSVGMGDERLSFDTIYPALGSTVHSDLAGGLGAELTEDGCIKVDAHQRTNVPGLYAAGDVVIGLDQISHALGQAGVAATTLRNDLAAPEPLLREDH